MTTLVDIFPAHLDTFHFFTSHLDQPDGASLPPEASYGCADVRYVQLPRTPPTSPKRLLPTTTVAPVVLKARRDGVRATTARGQRVLARRDALVHRIVAVQREIDATKADLAALGVV